ncbi:MAG TPA: metalloregulator ArsR/SmtB family transcription factor [Tepidisphaeraceae bacterium]|nr:metalloregulator ArsR/SmtB family transcription factor [Tepidisphaeraceae bacterium]
MRKRSPELAEMELEPLTSLFRLLSDKTRLNILMLLAEGERNVTSLCDELNLPQPTVSHHLGLLRMNNIIANRRNGKQVFYGLNGCVDASVGSCLQVSVANFEVRITERELVGVGAVA